MMHLVAGLLLPESILRNPKFVTLSILVAFNTLVYLGLTGSRMLWWLRPKVGLSRDEALSLRRADSPAIANVLPPPRHVLAAQRAQVAADSKNGVPETADPGDGNAASGSGRPPVGLT